MNTAKIIRVCDIIIECGFLVIVFFVPLIFDFTRTNYNNFDILRLAGLRIIVSLILLAYVAKTFVRGEINLRSGNKIFIFVVFLLISFFVSSLLSIHPNLSFWGSYERQQGFYSLIHYLLFFLLLILNLNNLGQVRRLITAALISGFLTCLYGLSQFFGFDPLPWQDDAFLSGRIFSSLGQPNFFAHYLILIMPLTVYAVFFIAQKTLVKFLVSLAVFIEFFCLISTYSRAAWLGLATAAVSVGLFWFWRQRRKKMVLTLTIGFLLVILAAVGLNFTRPASQDRLFGPAFINRLKSITDLSSGSNKMRLYYWQAVIQEIRAEGVKRLLVGYGPDTLDAVFIKYYRPDWAVYETINSYNDRAHCWPLDIILSYGLIGLAIMLSFYFYLAYKASRFLFSQEARPAEEIWLAVTASASLIAYSANNLFSFSLVVAYVYLFFILALLWFAVGGQKVKNIRIRLTLISKTLVGLALLTVICLFIYFNNINLLRADYYFMKAKKAEKQNDCPGLLSNMELAVSYNTTSAYYKGQYVLHGLNCFSSLAGKNDQLGLRDIIEAQIKTIKPNDFGYVAWLSVARAYSLFGFYVDPAYYKKAEKIYNDLIISYPNLLTPYQDFVRLKVRQKDYAGAVKLLKQAENFFPPLDHPQLNQKHRREIQIEEATFYENGGLACVQLRDYNQALKYYSLALAFNPYRFILYKSMADIFYLRGQLDRAIALNQRGLTLNPADYHWPLALSLLYREKKDLAMAKDYLARALKIAPENEELKKYSEELNR